MTNPSTVEAQYQICLDIDREKGRTPLGLMTNQVWQDDPRRLAFLLARYKFVAKMLAGRQRVLEVGCGDGFGSRVVQQEVDELTVSDIDPVFIQDIKARMAPDWPVTAVVHDILEGPLPGEFDGIYSLDVLEHIEPDREHRFLRSIVINLSAHGVCLIGMPSLYSQEFASPSSRAGHVNCKTAPDLKEVLETHFHSVFIFSMNDELVHTGFAPMAHYLLGLCVEPRIDALSMAG